MKMLAVLGALLFGANVFALNLPEGYKLTYTLKHVAYSQGRTFDYDCKSRENVKATWAKGVCRLDYLVEDRIVLKRTSQDGVWDVNINVSGNNRDSCGIWAEGKTAADGSVIVSDSLDGNACVVQISEENEKLNLKKVKGCVPNFCGPQASFDFSGFALEKK
jgi:hypothetical protein